LVHPVTHRLGLDGAAVDRGAEALGDLVGRRAAEVAVADHGGPDAAFGLQLVEGVGDRTDAARVEDQVAGRAFDEVRVAEALAAVLRDQEHAWEHLLHRFTTLPGC
jgi:hypothetical protein